MPQRRVGGEVGRLDWDEILKGLEYDAKEFGFYQQRVWATVGGHYTDGCQRQMEEEQKMITTSKQHFPEFKESPQTMPWVGSCSLLKVELRKVKVLLRDDTY